MRLRSRLYGRVVVAPGVLKTMGQLFNRLNAARTQHQAPRCGSAHCSNEPDQLLHPRPLLHPKLSSPRGLRPERTRLDAVSWIRAVERSAGQPSSQPGTLLAMDKVRFGRALGYGARHTAKALYRAVDAARAPGEAQPAQARPTEARPTVQSPRPTAAASVETARVGAKQVQAQAKHLGKSVWTPVARFSSVLWLQVTGSVYAVIALAMGQAVWTHRADLHLSVHSSAGQREFLLLGIFVLFAYFALSSFVRAARREKR